MKNLLILIIMLSSPTVPNMIFDFTENSSSREWRVIDDVVMGGRSSGSFSINADGHGVFEGEVSLENNGGFSSVRHRLSRKQVDAYSKVSIRLKGDGKQYQFRIRANAGDYYSYIMPFQTSGEWEEIEILLGEMYPTFRGRNLNQPNFSEGYIEEVTFLIANKQEEKFRLLIDKIELK